MLLHVVWIIVVVFKKNENIFENPLKYFFNNYPIEIV